MPTYQRDIASLRTKLTATNIDCPVFPDLNFNSSISVGDELDGKHLKEAERVAKSLRIHFDAHNTVGSQPAIDERLVQMAESRAFRIRMEHSTSDFGSVSDPALFTARDFMNAMTIMNAMTTQLTSFEERMMTNLNTIKANITTMDQRVANLEVGLIIPRPKSANQKILERNINANPEDPIQPFQKWIPGSGCDLIANLSFNGKLTYFAKPAAAIGVTPPYDGVLFAESRASLADILGIIDFYNYGFGMLGTDSNDTLCQKIHTIFTSRQHVLPLPSPLE